MTEILMLKPASIRVGERLRSIDERRVVSLMESMRDIGLRTPVSVRLTEDGDTYDLIAGAHRLAAANRMGWAEVACLVMETDDIAAQLWEIDENLSRAELSPAEQAEHISMRTALIIERNKRANCAKTTNTPGRPAFVAETASVTGLSDAEVRRASTRANNIAPDVLHKIKGTSLDKGVELDALARQPAEKQRELADEAATGRYVTARAKPAEDVDDDLAEQQMWSLKKAWEMAGPKVRAQFLKWVNAQGNAA